MKKHSSRPAPVRNPSSIVLPTELPFVARHLRRRGSKSAGSLWQVPPADDYRQAYRRGGDYAALFVQYLHDHPSAVGSNLLGRIARDMDFSGQSAARGYQAGFFAHLERLIYARAAHCDVFADLDRFNERAALLHALWFGTDQR